MFLTVLLLAVFPALANFSGGLLAESLRPSRKYLNRALHGATGIILAVVAAEVMPRALQQAPAWLLTLAFLSGGIAHLFLETGVKRWQESKKTGAGTGTWMVYVAVSTDLIGDGLLIGTGTAVSFHLALLVTAAQVLADLPEGFAVIANFRDKGVKRINRLLLSASFVLPAVGAAVCAYFILQETSKQLKMAALVFVAGLYVLAAVEDMLREAHDSAEDTRWSALSFLAGFALFLLISVGLG